MFKTNSEVIKIEAKKIKPINTGVVFWSHDRGTAKLKFKLMKDNLPQPIPDGTTVPIRLTFSSPTAEGGYGKHDYLATIEDKIGGIVSITLQDNILGYQGIVHGSIYMDFPGDTSLDTAGRFSFEIQRSPIDETTPELEDYYFNGFSKVIDQVEQLIDDTNKRIDGLNTEIDKANGTLDRIEDEIKESAGMTEKFINSIDFGDYDYSGNPNLMSVIKASDFRRDGNSDVLISDVGYNSIRFTTQNVNNIKAYTQSNISSLVSGKTYTISAKIKIEEGTTGNINEVKVSYRKTAGGTILLSATATGIEVGKEITIKGTGVVNYAINDLSRFYLSIWVGDDINGSVIVSDVKIEEGSTATPYQPNLLDAPYYLSKAPLGENIADPTKTFPINSSSYKIYEGDTKEELMIGQTYTITLKGTKPGNSAFAVHNDDTIYFGSLKPVEGLTDIWSLTFTPTEIASNEPKKIRIFQYRSSVEGASRIDWLKVEESDTRTPNINHLRYKGIGVTKNSINKYLWEENTLLEKVYTNSIDFGNYDYSGNPNVMSKPYIAENITSSNPALVVTPIDNGVRIEKTGVDVAASGDLALGNLLNNTDYVISYDILVENGYIGDLKTCNISLDGQLDGTPKYNAVFYMNGVTSTGVWQKVSVKFNSGADMEKLSNFKFRVFLSRPVQASLKIKNVKIERGSTATPYQPNLLDEPYYLSKAPLGENIADPAQTFPIKTSGPILHHGTMKESFVVGETYTITLKGTKPSTQFFRVFNPGINGYGNMSPVEGLTDVWSLTFTPNAVSTDPTLIEIIQTPTTSAGACQIDWIKIEKGDTRTPNILDYKYIGEKSIYSNDYQNINWDVTENYIDNKFNIMVDTVNPQAIGGAKNFLETPFVNNSPIVYDENPLPFEAWYSQAKEVRPCSHKSRLPIGRELTNIGKTRRRLMKDNPLQWNSGQWEAQVLRDCILLIEGTVILEFGSNSGIWTYIDVWNDTAQTSIIGEGAGTGVGDPSKLWFRNEVAFSRYVALSKGTQLSIGTSMPEGKQLTKAVMRSMHIMEIDIE